MDFYVSLYVIMYTYSSFLLLYTFVVNLFMFDGMNVNAMFVVLCKSILD